MSMCLTGRTQIELSTHTYPYFRFADRLGLGIDFDFRQPDMPNLRRKICYRLCTYKVPAL